MKITVTGRHMSITEVLKDYVLSKTEHLGHYFDNLQKIEEQFIATVGQVAASAAERVPEDMREASGRAARTSTESTRQAAAAMTKLSQRLAGTSVELGLTCLQVSGELGVRCAQIAGGWLAAMAEVFDKPAADDASKKR